MTTVPNHLVRRFFAFVLALLVAPAALAALNLPAPEALYERASLGRTELREVLLDLQQNTWEMRDPKVFDSYFFLLDRLAPLAERTKLDEIYPQAVEATGLRMVAHGIRWLDFSRRELADTRYYLRYADADVIARLLAETELLVKSLTVPVFQPALLRKVATHLELVLELCEARFPLRRDLQISVRSLTSTLAMQFLRRQDLTPDELDFWIAHLQMPASYAEYVQTIQDELLLLPATKASHEQLARLSSRLDKIGRRIDAETFPLPAYIPGGWGEAVVELILRSIAAERPFAAGEFDGLLGRLKARQLQGLAGQWMTEDRLPSLDYAEASFALSRVFLDRLRELSLTRESDEVARRLVRVAAPLEARRVGLEGHYELTAQDGSRYEFTAIFARPNLLYVAMGSADGVVTTGYFNVIFDPERRQFLATQREPDLDPSANPALTFTAAGDGRLSVLNPLAIPERSRLTGRRTRVFAKPRETDGLTLTEGTWEGQMTLSGGKPWNVKLVITRLGSQSVGRLIANGNVQIDFQTGGRGDRGVVSLTTGRLPRTSWVHLRAEVRDGRLEGQLVSGSRGVTAEKFILKKTENQENRP